MAYEAQGREIARELEDRHGRLLEARLGAPIVLVFERAEWSVPSNFIFKFGYSGSGPDCFHAFLEASGFTVSKPQIENAKSGEVFTAPGFTPSPVDAYTLDADRGVVRVSAPSIVDHEKAREDHERAVALLDRGAYAEALKIFNAVQEATRDDPEPMTFLNIAVCHAHLGEFPRALDVLRDAVTRWPDNQRLRMNYAAIEKDARAYAPPPPPPVSEPRVARAPAFVSAASGVRPAKKRLVVGLVLALLMTPLALAGAALDRTTSSRDRTNMVMGSILLLCWGSGLIAAAMVVRSRHSRVTALAAGPDRDPAEIARQTGVSEALVRQWIGEPPPVLEGRDGAGGVKVRELRAKAAALEQAIFSTTTRRLRVQALEAGNQRRLRGARRIALVTALVLMSPILILAALVAALVLLLPGVLYVVYLAFSEWDEFEANPHTADLSAGGAMLTLAGLGLFPIAAGFVVCAAIAARLGVLRPLVIARTEREFIIAALVPTSLLRPRFESVEVFPIENASLELAEAKRRTTVLCFTSGATRRYIAVRTAKGFLSGTAESVENRALLMQAVVRERPAAAVETIAAMSRPLPVAIIPPDIPKPQPQAAPHEAVEGWSDAETVHARNAPRAVPAPGPRSTDSLRPGLSTATAIGGVLALGIFSFVVVWLTLRAPAGTSPRVVSAPATATAPIAAPVPSAEVPPAPVPLAPSVAAPSQPAAPPPPTRTAPPTPTRSQATEPRRVPSRVSAPSAPTAQAESPVAPPASAAAPVAPPAAPVVDSAAVRDALEAGARSENAAEWEAALNHYQTARKLDPSLGVIVDSAIERVKARLGPAARDAFNRARQYDALGRAVDAITWYERALRGLPETDPDRETAVARLAILRRGAR